MKNAIAILAVILAVVAVVPAFAELQNVAISGDIRIRGNYFSSEAVADDPTARNPLFDWWGARAGGVIGNSPGLRWPAASVYGRAVGGGGGVFGLFSWEDEGHSAAFVEQRTRVAFTAEFTDNVSAVIELDSYDIWGEDFRSNYITGGDMRAATGNDVEVYQSYIQATEMWGMPLGMRIGRQEIQLGSEWLIGNNDTSAIFTGLSFDGIRLWYEMDALRIDAMWAKLADTSPMEEDGDVDLYGIYGSYTGLEDITPDAYWLMIRDARQVEDTVSPGDFFFWPADALEDWFGVDDYEPTTLHTIGLRGTGTVFGALDFEAELAYQFGEMDSTGTFFRPSWLAAITTYGDDDADISEWGLNLEVGYTFEIAWQPRVFLGFAYLGGEDERDVNFLEWLDSLINPWAERDASVSFNRLFSDWEYSEILENTDLSNAMIFRTGVEAAPTESVDLTLLISYYESLEEFDAPANVELRGYRLYCPMSFITESNDDDLGWEVELIASYDYTEDLSFEVGWAHLFVGDGLEEGNYSNLNGLGFNGGRDDDDVDYLYFETKLSF